ncbi:MAG: hypothetical protein QOE61_3001 [Micromonosporaceae bacterium]|nr:hypothetical protein [Micromonosporaceae bacterium]
METQQATTDAKRVFTVDALQGLSMSPRDRLLRLIADSDVDGVRGELDLLEQAHHGQMTRYTDWVASVIDSVLQRHGQDGLRLLVGRTSAFFAAYPAVGTVRADLPAPMTAPVVDEMLRGDASAAIDIFDAREDEWRAVIDLYRDWISALLSHVYSTYGADELELFHRRRGEDVLRHLMDDIDQPPGLRLVNFVRLLHGHFTELAVTEDDEKFTIVQDPCGTCARQVIDGRFASGLDLAVINDRHPVTWGGRATTIYRTHVPIWHVEMARERLGVPWPVNICPAGLDGGECTILLYKDPRDPSAGAQVPTAGNSVA